MGQQRQRDHYFDNAKFILITLVVIGHAIRPLIHQSSFLNTLYLTIYTFHMPVFIFIAGYFSKNFKRKDQHKKIISQIFIPYIIFQTLYSVFHSLLKQSADLEVSAFDPYWIMWFLLSLFFWRVLLPYFIELKYPIAIAFMLAIFIGYIDEADDFLSLSRTIAFFPFFLIGYFVQRHHIERMLLFVKRWVGVFGLAIVFLLMYYVEHQLMLPFDFRRWLYFVFPYAELEHTEWYAGLYRLGLFALTIVASISFLAIIPQRRLTISRLGTRSMYVYLWHGFFIQLFKEWDPASKLDTFFQYSAVIAGAIILSLVLSTDMFQRITHPLVRPQIDWIFKKG